VVTAAAPTPAFRPATLLASHPMTRIKRMPPMMCMVCATVGNSVRIDQMRVVVKPNRTVVTSERQSIRHGGVACVQVPYFDFRS
jgi:hypothetical protein